MEPYRSTEKKVEGVCKLEWEESGEIRRWPARILQHYSPVKNGPQDLLGLIQATFMMPTLECMSYIDGSGDVVLCSIGDHFAADLDLEIALDYLSSQENKSLNFKLHTTKDQALEYASKMKKKVKKAASLKSSPSGTRAHDVVSQLGPRPGLLVALDLGIPVREARELVRRATNGDEIAIRVISSSHEYFKQLQASKSLDVLFNMQKFAQAHRIRTAKTNPVCPRRCPAVRSPIDNQSGQKRAVHFGIVCDGCDMSPIIGTRWHLKGKDYDLCDTDYSKLSDEEKEKYEEIKHPCTARPLFAQLLQKAGESFINELDKSQTPPAPAAEKDPVPPADEAAQDEIQEKKTDEVEHKDDESKEEKDFNKAINDLPPPYEEPVATVQNCEPDSESIDDLVLINSNNPPPAYVDTNLDHAIDVSVLTSMGFQGDAASRVLLREGSVEKAVESLIQETPFEK